MTFEEAVEPKEVYETYIKDICIKESKSSEEYSSYDRYIQVLLCTLYIFSTAGFKKHV